MLATFLDMFMYFSVDDFQSTRELDTRTGAYAIRGQRRVFSGPRLAISSGLHEDVLRR